MPLCCRVQLILKLKQVSLITENNFKLLYLLFLISSLFLWSLPDESLDISAIIQRVNNDSKTVLCTLTSGKNINILWQKTQWGLVKDAADCKAEINQQENYFYLLQPLIPKMLGHCVKLKTKKHTTKEMICSLFWADIQLNTLQRRDTKC